MDHETRDMFQMILHGMEKMEKRIDTRMDNMERKIDENKAEIAQTKIQIMVKMENDITERLDALVDGYKGNYERQEEIARKVDEHDRRINRLETIAG